jgi:hypothetical protein
LGAAEEIVRRYVEPVWDNTVANVGASGYTLFAQKNGSGGYAAITNGPCAPTSLCFATGTGVMPPELLAGIDTIEQLAGSGTFVAGGALLSASEVPNVTLTAGQDTELVGAGNVAGDFFDLRIYKTGGTALNAYTQTARITVGGFKGRVGAR